MLPQGTTMLELVTCGLSVAIVSCALAPHLQVWEWSARPPAKIEMHSPQPGQIIR
jgi:hypothetical protein